VEAVVSETVDYARGEIPAQIEEKREIARMLKAGQFRKAVEIFGYGAVQSVVRMLKWQVGMGLQVADELMLNPRDRAPDDLVKLYHSDGRPYTETTQEMVGGTQEQPAYAWVERHVMFSTREPVGAVIRVKLGGYGSERHFRIESKGSDGRAVALPYGSRRNPRQPAMVEAPRDLREQVSWNVVQDGSRPDLEEEIQWRGPTKEPFLTMWEQGWRKYKARHDWESGPMVIHFWQSPAGDRAYLKIKNSPLDQGAVPLRNPRTRSLRPNPPGKLVPYEDLGRGMVIWVAGGWALVEDVDQYGVITSRGLLTPSHHAGQSFRQYEHAGRNNPRNMIQYHRSRAGFNPMGKKVGKKAAAKLGAKAGGKLVPGVGQAMMFAEGGMVAVDEVGRVGRQAAEGYTQAFETAQEAWQDRSIRKAGEAGWQGAKTHLVTQLGMAKGGAKAVIAGLTAKEAAEALIPNPKSSNRHWRRDVDFRRPSQRPETDYEWMTVEGTFGPYSIDIPTSPYPYEIPPERAGTVRGWGHDAPYRGTDEHRKKHKQRQKKKGRAARGKYNPRRNPVSFHVPPDVDVAAMSRHQRVPYSRGVQRQLVHAGRVTAPVADIRFYLPDHNYSFQGMDIQPERGVVKILVKTARCFWLRQRPYLNRVGFAVGFPQP
jgi:hypothetical protein